MTEIDGAATIAVIGGVYREWCMRPQWREIYGSAGRAAAAMATMGAKVRLHTYVGDDTLDSIQARAALDGFQLSATDVGSSVAFQYAHGLGVPRILLPRKRLPELEVSADKVVRFGMIESDVRVDARMAVYDPQNAEDPRPFWENGSKAKHLALVLNRRELTLMTGMSGATVGEMARALFAIGNVDAVVIKQGPLGAFVLDGSGEATVPAYRTDTVWKIGSGDNFVAHFAYRWMHEGRPVVESADLASKATAYFCATAGFATHSDLAAFSMQPIKPSQQFIAGRRPTVYLAGPFFNLAQHWLVEEARSALMAMGLNVFSPLHDVGHGAAEEVASQDLAAIQGADLIFALGDGLDSGTMYELGYANASGKPVIIYCENEPEGSKKMMIGSGCQFFTDFVSAIYNASWAACEL
jgi:hypothetical protein